MATTRVCVCMCFGKTIEISIFSPLTYDDKHVNKLSDDEIYKKGWIGWIIFSDL